MPLCMKDMSLLCIEKVFLIRDTIILPMSGPMASDRRHFCNILKLRMYKDFLVYLSRYGREVPSLQALLIYSWLSQIEISIFFVSYLIGGLYASAINFWTPCRRPVKSILGGRNLILQEVYPSSRIRLILPFYIPVRNTIAYSGTLWSVFFASNTEGWLVEKQDNLRHWGFRLENTVPTDDIRKFLPTC